MAVEYLGKGVDDGLVIGRPGLKMSLFGVTTVTSKQAVVTTVDSTTITTVDTTTITTVDTTTVTDVVGTAIATNAATTNTGVQTVLKSRIAAHAAVINNLVLESRLHSLGINRMIADGRLISLGVNRLIADSRSQAKADNQLITKLRALGLFASS